MRTWQEWGAPSAGAPPQPPNRMSPSAKRFVFTARNRKTRLPAFSTPLSDSWRANIAPTPAWHPPQSPGRGQRNKGRGLFSAIFPWLPAQSLHILLLPGKGQNSAAASPGEAQVSRALQCKELTILAVFLWAERPAALGQVLEGPRAKALLSRSWPASCKAPAPIKENK